MTRPLVTFDLWETLIYDPAEYPLRRRDARLSLFHRALRDFGHDIDPVQLSVAYDSSWDRIRASWRDHKDVDVPDQVRIWISTLNGSDIHLDGEQYSLLNRLYVQPFRDLGAEIIPGARETVQAARDNGFVIGLISNTGRTPGWALRDDMARLGILSLFDFTVFSNEELVRKPSPEIFSRAAARAGVSTGWHIGDSYQYDVLGAQGAGWTPIWIAGAPLRSETPAEDRPCPPPETEIWPHISHGRGWFAARRIELY